MIRAENKVVTFKPSKPEQVSTCVGKCSAFFVMKKDIGFRNNKSCFSLEFSRTKPNHFPIKESGFFVCHFLIDLGVKKMKLIAVTDNSHSVAELAFKILQIKDVVDYVHIREKSKTPKQMLTLLKLLEEGGMAKEKVVLNDRLDVALLKQIPTIHLPSQGLPVKEVKRQFPHIRVGCSIHSVEEAIQAERDGADYVLYGHCFETNSKIGLAPNGIEPILEMKKGLRIPVYAIGGITPGRVAVLQTVKADGIAIMSGIFSVHDPRETALTFLEKCEGKVSEKLL